MSGLSGEVSAIAQYAGSITLSVTNGETASVIALKAGETVIASESIHMSGMVTFDGLSGGTTTIDGACIKTGTVSASRLDLTGAITFADLSDEVRNDIDDSWSMAAGRAGGGGERGGRGGPLDLHGQHLHRRGHDYDGHRYSLQPAGRDRGAAGGGRTGGGGH